MKPLFILPFDHRSGLTHELFAVPYPPSPAIAKKIVALKNLIFEGFLLAHQKGSALGELGILIDEEFGSAVIKKAKALGVFCAISTEKSGGSTFSFVHGRGFGRALVEQAPTYAKALVQYTIGDDDLNEEKMTKLKALSVFCQDEGIPLMLEPLLTGKKSALTMATTMIRDMHAHGVYPALWKLEPMPSARAWQKLDAVARAPMILLGRGAALPEVERWIITAAKSGVVDGFAIGRTIFFEPIKKFHEGKITRAQAKEQIAKNYLRCIRTWNKHSI